MLDFDFRDLFNNPLALLVILALECPWVPKFRFASLVMFSYRSVKMPGRVGAVIPVEGSDNLLAGIERKLCLVDRKTGI